MVTKRCRQRNLHEMSYTIKYRVKTRMATGVAVSTERVKWECTINGICLWHFLCKFCISFGNIIKKNITLPLLKNLHLPMKKNRTSSVFMLE